MSAEGSTGMFERIQNHTGTRILEALRTYGVSARILSGNCLQLRQLIRLLEDPSDPAKVMCYEQRRHLQGLFDEVIRHFHNFLTSIKTLVDHTRNLMKEDFVRDEHRREYQDEVEARFAADPFTQFMQDFRDYMTHYTIPIVGLTGEIGSPEAHAKPAELYVDVVHLAKWGGWTAPSRKFIATRGAKVRMLELVDSYEHRIRQFHEEIGKSFQRYYEPEITEALTLMQKCRAVFKA